jgi:hypothetical protein
MSKNILSIIKDSLKNWLKTFHLRLPKPGLPAPLIIPGSMIKTLMKTAISEFLQLLKAFILSKFAEVANAVGTDKVTKLFAVMAVIKLMFGTTLDKVKGSDIKAFIQGLLDTVVYPALDQVETLISAAKKLKGDFKSIKDTLIPPDPINAALKAAKGNGPFYEIGSKEIKDYLDPIVEGVLKAVSQSVPYPVILAGCAFTPTRSVLTKVHPLKPFEILPTWEGLSLKNIPYVIWLDQLVASAQRCSALGSNYIVPYFQPIVP